MSIHKEGYVIVFTSICVLLIVSLCVHFFIHHTGFKYSIYGFLLLCFLFILLFFRLPDREINRNENAIIAPADGEIVIIKEVEETEYFHDKRLQVSIFMSPLNVHVNWYPMEGMVKYYKYHPGKYLVAWHPKASTLNERTTIVLENNKKKQVLCRQIAGMVARRIVCYAKEGNTFQQGDEMGFIKFGSRVDLFLPLDAKIQVALNQKVIGRNTVIALFE